MSVIPSGTQNVSIKIPEHKCITNCRRHRTNEFISPMSSTVGETSCP